MIGSSARARVIVIGNEKGGSGKSTVSVHVAVGLLHAGYRIATLDLDPRQGTLTRYLGNRHVFATASSLTLAAPVHRVMPEVAEGDGRRDPVNAEEKLTAVLEDLGDGNDAIVIDTPGADTLLSRLAHSYADVIVTPINDSLIDFDGLAQVDPESREILEPSHYSEMVWEQKKARALRDRASIEWIVMRNRLSSLPNRNMREVTKLMEALSRRIGFRTVQGFSERVIFRELFLQGLTLLDIGLKGTGIRMTMSHITGRNELRGLLAAIVPAAKLTSRESLGAPILETN